MLKAWCAPMKILKTLNFIFCFVITPKIKLFINNSAENIMFLLSILIQCLKILGNLSLIPETEYLTLSTIHSAKGLEWNTVFVIYALEGRFPTMRSAASDEEMEEGETATVKIVENIFIKVLTAEKEESSIVTVERS